MINFIICDDEEIFRESLKEKIDSCMMKTTIEYKTHFFDCYDRKFKDFTENINQFNVYFLDIITPHVQEWMQLGILEIKQVTGIQ